MTEATAGSEGTALTGTPAATTGAAEGSTGGATDPFSGLETGTREWVGTKGYKSVADVVTAARNAESLIGRSIQLPGADAKPEDWDKVYSKLGRPEKADAYEFKLPDGLPANFNYDAEQAKAFKSWAHAAGLTPKQAAALHDAKVKADATAFDALQKQVTESAAAATAALEKAYGGVRDSQPFKDGVNFAVRALEGLDKVPGVTGLQKALEGAGLLVNGVVIEPSIAVALTHIGKALFKEDSLETGVGATGDNPFTKGKENLTAQMQMLANDRQRAMRLIAAAGRQAVEFGLT